MIVMRKLAFVALSFVLSTTAHAQYTPPASQAAMDIGVAGSIYMGDEATWRNDDISIGIGNINLPRPQSGKILDDVEFTYAPSKSRTATNLQNIVSRWRKQNPAHGTQLEQLFAQNDVVGAVGGVMEQFGLQRNNVAHAYSFYWVVNWGLANKVHDTPSVQAMQGVAAQLEQSLAVTPNFMAMNDAEKQAAAEELMVLVALLDAGSEEAKTNPAIAAQLAKAALENGRKVGFELDKMKLTEEGFEPL
jgi:hypothetical protein